MKIFLINFLLILLYSTCYSQNSLLDTIYYSRGKYAVINLGEREKIYPNGPPLGKVILDEKNIYNSRNELIGVQKHLGGNRFTYIEWREEGSVYLNYSNWKKDIFDETLWNSEGIILNQNTQTNGHVLEKEFYNSNGMIRFFREVVYLTPDSLSIIFLDSLINQYWVEAEYREGQMIRSVFECQFYNNGLIKECGNYTKRIFDIYASEAAFIKGESPVATSEEKKCKNGEWVIYSEEGVKRKENMTWE